ncbi:MAG: hypothetical protein ABSE86_33880 [Bryobacteraceae bacterium]
MRSTGRADTNLLIGIASVAVFNFAATATGPVSPTFSKEVAPILSRHCVTCHRAGEIASAVPLLIYDEVRPWAKSIKEKVITREMPPWPADPNRSLRFRNDASLDQKEINTLVAWVNAGAPKGNDTDSPPPPVSAAGWRHPTGRNPDLIISMPQEFEVPAQGTVPYVRRLVNVPLSQDRWVAALQVRPGNPAVVHHIAITEDTLDKGVKPADLEALASFARQQGFQNVLPGLRPAVPAPGNNSGVDMLGVYTPGTTLEMYDDDTAKLMKGGENSYINFNIHYQPNGQPQKDRSMIGFWFRSSAPRHQLFRVPGATKTIIANGREILSDARGRKAEGTGAAIPPIPPNQENYEVTGITAYQEPIVIFQFQPHAHIRCKDFQYTVVYPDGREQSVLSVPKFNFQWQLAYDLETPLHLAAGSKLVVTAHYDNSRNNKYNPAPDQEVHFRDVENQSWDEMFTPFVQFSTDIPDFAQQTNAAGPHAKNVPDIVEVDGCLVQSGGIWMLTRATSPIASESQATTSAALKSAEGRPLGNETFQLLGVNAFSPAGHLGQKVAVKGVWIKANGGINVTSLQMAAAACGQ